MPDHAFADTSLAALYDSLAPPDARGDFGFYLPMIMAAESVLDIGCGTGALLGIARGEGHSGRLCGLDPAVGMLEQARKLPGIEWVHGDLESVSWDREFDLAVMTGHAFQVFLQDDEIRRSLAAVRKALKVGGRFAFETRNPAAREWERWPDIYTKEVTDAAGNVVRSVCRVDEPVTPGIVSFSHTFTSAGWKQPEISRSVLRFLELDDLNRFLRDTGFVVEGQFGDWDRSPVTDTSPEIITIARRV